MYRGVLRDDERRREKFRQREEELRTSQRKRELYEQVQKVKQGTDVWLFVVQGQGIYAFILFIEVETGSFNRRYIKPFVDLIIVIRSILCRDLI
jgi:hypothetical protein